DRGQTLEGARLAGPVRADEGDASAGRDREADVVHRHDLVRPRRDERPHRAAEPVRALRDTEDLAQTLEGDGGGFHVVLLFSTKKNALPVVPEGRSIRWVALPSGLSVTCTVDRAGDHVAQPRLHHKHLP